MLIGYLYDFEVALAFPIGDGVEPLTPFPFAGRGEMIDEIVAEPVARAVGLTKDARRLDQRARCAGNVFRADVRAVDRWRGERQVPLNAIEPGGDARRDREVGVDVRPRAARLEPRGLRRPGEHAKARRAIVDAPRRLDGCPETVDEPLVAVDRRPEHRRELQQ